MTLVLDAGALTTLERGDRATAAVVEAARRAGRPVIVPAGVVGQAWRVGRRQVRLARLLGAPDVTVDPLTDGLARAAGALCGQSATSDVIDASVVLAARRHHATVLTSGRGDIQALDPTLPLVDC